MKYLLLINLFVFVSTYSFSQTITIDEFEDYKQEISSKSIKNGFKIQIIEKSGIEKIKIMNDAGKFIDVTEFETITGGKIYSIKEAKVENSILKIQLIKGGETKNLTLTVTESPLNDIPPATCIPKVSKTKCSHTRNFENKFGEEAKYYDKRKIVYVYDFNPDPSKREFYKITLNKEYGKGKDNENSPGLQRHDGLDIEVANFNKERLTPGKNVKFKIYNINKFMYDISIADSVIQFDSEPSALFSRFFLGDSTFLGSLMQGFSDGLSAQNNGEEISEVKEINQLLNTIIAELKCFVEQYNWIQNEIIGAYGPCYSFPCCYSIEYVELANLLANIRGNTTILQSKLDEQRKIVKEKTKLIETCKSNRNTLEKNKTAAGKLATAINKLEEEIKKTSGDERKKKEEELKNKIKANDKLTVEREKLEKSYKESCGTNKEAQYSRDKKDAEKILADFKAINTLLDNLPTDNDLKKAIVFLRNIVESNSTHTSDYISLNGNALDLTITIASKDSIFHYFSIPEYKNDPIQIQIPIIGKTFPSFSSGSFISIGQHLQNKTYSWQETVGNNNTADSTSFTLTESGYTFFPSGFCALGNVEWKFSPSLGIGASAGVGLTIEREPRLAYLGGVSLFFGELRQFSLTGGLAGMNVNRLTRNLQTIADNQIIYTNKASIDYFKELKVGAFVSLTYTPFKIVKTKTPKSKTPKDKTPKDKTPKSKETKD